MGRFDDVIAVGIIILIVLLLVFLMKGRGAVSTQSRSATNVPSNMEKLVDDNLLEATHLPKYRMVSVENQKPIAVADYTSVPYKFGEYLKPFEPPEITVSDEKVETALYERSDNVEEESILQQERAKVMLQSALLDGSGATQKEDGMTTFIKSLDVSKDCVDAQPELCEQWKNNNECLINPEYMLFNCPSACASCNMSQSQKNLLSIIYNRRDPLNCVSHGGYEIEYKEAI